MKSRGNKTGEKSLAWVMELLVILEFDAGP